MNVYRYRFTAKCPNNRRTVEYSLVLHSQRMVMVEAIVKACSGLKAAYHEQIAERLYNEFGGYQVISAHHQGVDVETQRGSQG